MFSANLIKHALRWFKCGAAGNQLDLWAKATKKPLHEAALELCARLHREVPAAQELVDLLRTTVGKLARFIPALDRIFKDYVKA